MNTRLQVEHPVTEAVYGVDLVCEQIHLALGDPLSFRQQDLTPRGHAIECRIYAEDASRGFMPSVGKIQFLRMPAGPGVRNDSGVYEGFDVPVHYDPLLAKLITWGADREEAMARARAALIEYRIEGPISNIPFLRWILSEPAFVNNEVHTGWLEAVQGDFRHVGIGFGIREEVAAIAAAIHAHRASEASSLAGGADGPGEGDGLSPWVRVGRSKRLGGVR